mgnify:FL=1
MPTSVVTFLRGYVKVEIRGGRLEKLLNLLVERRLLPWDIVVENGERAVMHIHVRDFFRLRPLLKETGCRVHVIGRHGLPFFLDKLAGRKFFAAGIILFIIGIYALSSVVWSVSVDGNEKLGKEQILQAAKQVGIYPLQWKFRLKDPDALSKGMHRLLPGVAWIGVEVYGTQVRIKVVESREPDPAPLMSPRHLIASRNALVTEIFTEKGRPLVKPNTYVRKGDVLISGIVGEGPNQQVVVAKGKVKGLVWYTSVIEVPLAQKIKVYTGEKKSRSYLMIGNRGLKVAGFGNPPFTDYETIVNRTTVQWRDFKLPFGWLTEKLMAMQYVERPVDREEARKRGMDQAKADLLLEAGPGAVVVAEKILHERVENGKVYMEAHFEVEQYIAEELPIIQGQGE